LIYNGAQSARELEVLLAEIRSAGKGKPYDCVIGVSGGADSSYLGYLTTVWGLRPLAVQMDNGWNSEEAVKNIKRVSTKFSIDYESYVLNWEEFRQIQLAFLKASIVEMEIPTDVAIIGSLHQVAARHGVKFILSGGNLATEGILPRSWFYHPKDARLLRAICRRFGVKSIRSLPTFDFLTEFYYKFLRGIRVVYPLNYVDYSKDTAIAFLKEQCDWVEYGGKHHESRFTKMVQGYLQPVKFNIDYRRATFSTQICAGKMTRESALSELTKLPYDPAKIEVEKEFFAKKLGISMAEFAEILEAPTKSYRDYPNNERFLDLVYNTYRKLFGKNRSFPSAAYES